MSPDVSRTLMSAVIQFSGVDGVIADMDWDLVSKDDRALAESGFVSQIETPPPSPRMRAIMNEVKSESSNSLNVTNNLILYRTIQAEASSSSVGVIGNDRFPSSDPFADPFAEANRVPIASPGDMHKGRGLFNIGPSIEATEEDSGGSRQG